MILLIDNYDSFTFNLMHLIGSVGETVKVVRNDELTVDEAIDLKADAIFLSPGPGRPESAGICLELIEQAARTNTAVFGVCLGMQSIAQCFGGKIVLAGELMHGKTCQVRHEGGCMFNNVPSPLVATRYHSLVAEEGDLPSTLNVDARANGDDEIMALSHKELPIAGVQFHPESIASEHGEKIITNFLVRARQ